MSKTIKSVTSFIKSECLVILVLSFAFYSIFIDITHASYMMPIWFKIIFFALVSVCCSKETIRLYKEYKYENKRMG